MRSRQAKFQQRNKRRKSGLKFFIEGYWLHFHYGRQLQLLPWTLALEITYITTGRREVGAAAVNEFARSLYAHALNTSNLRKAQEARSACVDLVKNVFGSANRSIVRLRFATKAPALAVRRQRFEGIRVMLAPPVVAAVITGLIAITIKIFWPN